MELSTPENSAIINYLDAAMTVRRKLAISAILKITHACTSAETGSSTQENSVIILHKDVVIIANQKMNRMNASLTITHVDQNVEMVFWMMMRFVIMYWLAVALIVSRLAISMNVFQLITPVD